MGKVKVFFLIATLAIGMSIYNQGAKVIDNTSSQIDSMAIQTHNVMFSGYTEGQFVKGSQVKDLALKIMSHNKNISDSEYFVRCNVDSTNLSTIKSSQMYEIVDITYENGIIISITFDI